MAGRIRVCPEMFFFFISFFVCISFQGNFWIFGTNFSKYLMYFTQLNLKIWNQLLLQTHSKAIWLKLKLFGLAGVITFDKKSLAYCKYKSYHFSFKVLYPKIVTSHLLWEEHGFTVRMVNTSQLKLMGIPWLEEEIVFLHIIHTMSTTLLSFMTHKPLVIIV